MLTQDDIDEINRILDILDFVNLTQSDIDFINEILPCLTEVPPCLYFLLAGKVINCREETCIDSQIKKLQEMSDCNGCDINFEELFNDDSVDRIWGGSVSGC